MDKKIIYQQILLDFLNTESDKYIEGIDFQIVWFHLMFNNYKALAQKFVNLGDRFGSEEEIIAFLKSRLEPRIA